MHIDKKKIKKKVSHLHTINDHALIYCKHSFIHCVRSGMIQIKMVEQGERKKKSERKPTKKLKKKEKTKLGKENVQNEKSLSRMQIIF